MRIDSRGCAASGTHRPPPLRFVASRRDRIRRLLTRPTGSSIAGRRDGESCVAVVELRWACWPGCCSWSLRSRPGLAGEAMGMTMEIQPDLRTASGSRRRSSRPGGGASSPTTA